MPEPYINLSNSKPDDLYEKFELMIDSDKEGRSKFLALPQQQKIIAYLFAFLHLELENLQGDIEMERSAFTTDNALQYVKNLRSLLRALREEDLSKDIEYALKLSKNWHGLTEYQESAASKELKTAAHVKIGKLIELFYQFPTSREHASLGFYLTEYAGENWLPFPFIKILSDLHEEHTQQEGRSNLAKVIRLLTNIIESFRLN